MLAQQDLIETNISKSPVLEGLERVSGSPYKEAVSQGEIAPFPWDHSSPRGPSLTAEIQEFTSSSGTGESSGDSSLESFATSEEYCPRGEDENSLELFTSTQGIKATTTTFETTPKSALNQAEMVEIPRQVPTTPKNFASRSKRGPWTCLASQGSCGSAASSQEGQYTTQEDLL